MAGEKCQVCGGKVVNGRCSLCGMPYRNDEALYHLNETREEHYGHASAGVRKKMQGYASVPNPGKTQQRAAKQTNSAVKQDKTIRTGQTARNIQRDMGRRTGRGGITELNRQKTEKPVTNMNHPTGGSQDKKTSAEQKKSGVSVWIIWLIIVLIGVLPQVWDFIRDWIGTNL